VDLLESIWVDKYRPKTINDVVFSGDQKQDFIKYVANREIPHICLYGPPGGGKTTIAMILSSKDGILNNPKDNLMEINGSAKNTRGIGFVEDTIVPYLKLPPIGDKHKILFIDEADYLTDSAFHALRQPIERFSPTTRFILTCNYISKIPDALQSRFLCYEFKQMPLDYVFDHCKMILENEKVEFEDKNIKYVISNLYPDIRRIVNTMQRCSNSGILKVNKDAVLTSEKLIVASIIEITTAIQQKQMGSIGKNIEAILKIVEKKDVEYRSLYSTLFFTKGIVAPAKVIINKYTNSHSDCLVPSMHFISLVFDIIKCLKEFYIRK